MRLLLLALIATSNPLAAANRIYIGSSLSTEFLEGLEFEVAPEWRSEPSSNTEKYQADISLSYELLKQLKLGIGYRIGTTDTDGERSDHDRYNLDTKYSLKWENLTTQLRLRYTDGNDEEGEDKKYIRYRVKFTYNLKELNLSPYIAYEYYDSLDLNTGKNRHVYIGGIGFELSERQDLSIGYRWVDKIQSKKDYGVMQTAYDFSF